MLRTNFAIFHSGGWTIGGTPLDLHDPRLLAMAAAERHLVEAEYDEYEDTNASGAAFCRSAALIVSGCYICFHKCNNLIHICYQKSWIITLGFWVSGKQYIGSV